jgi:hypothetical protein
MIDKFQVVQNSLILVSYNFITKIVAVLNIQTQAVSFFAGWDDLINMFCDFGKSISEETSFEDAVKFFTPNIGQMIISA